MHFVQGSLLKDISNEILEKLTSGDVSLKSSTLEDKAESPSTKKWWKHVETKKKKLAHFTV